MDEFEKILSFAMKEAQGSTAFSLERNRPYDGQSHTHEGIRGQTKVEGLTMRDVVDCMIRSFLECGGIETEFPIADDVYKIELENIDPCAVMQGTVCNIEKMMGIYPNISKPKEESDEESQ